MTLDLDAIRRRNPANADVKVLLAEVGRLHKQLNQVIDNLDHSLHRNTILSDHNARLEEACGIFERNSEGAVKLEAALRACLPILAVVGVPQMHHDCSGNCRGCQLTKDRDAVLHQAWEALGVKEGSR